MQKIFFFLSVLFFSHSSLSAWSHSTPPSAGTSTSSEYLKGPFDAWDTFRDNASVPPADKNISTKVVNRPFQLSLASLNKPGNAYEVKDNAGSYIDVAIYPKGSKTKISNSVTYDANADPHLASSADFIVSSAQQDAVVGFKFCATYEGSGTSSDKTYTLHPQSHCLPLPVPDDCDQETFHFPTWHVCHSTDNFAIRPHAFKTFGENQYKRAAEDFNLLIKAIDENNDSIASGSHAVVQGVNGYDVSTDTVSAVSKIYVPTSSELAQMQADTGVTDVSTCPQAGVFTLENADFENGELNATIKFSETGILDINISEVPGSEYALVDADDTNDTLRYIESSVFIYDQSDISRQNLLLFVPYEFITTAEYNATTTKDWLYMHDINTSNTSFTTPLMSANIFYTIVAKNKDGDTTQNYTKTCFPDVDEVNAPRVNGLKLNTTFDLFLDATINSTANASLSLYSEDNTSTALYTPTKNLNAVVGDNVIQEWISPLLFSNGQGNARVHLNIDRVNNLSLNPVNLKLVDINTSTSWMANPGSPELFTGQVLNIDKSFIYAKTNTPRQKFIDNKTPTDKNVLIYYQAYCDSTDAKGVTCDKALLPDGDASTYTDDPRWYTNSEHTSPNYGIAGEVAEKIVTNNITITTQPTGTHQDKVVLKYNGDSGYPLTKTMTNTVSEWLLYDKYNADTTSDEFVVEFYKDGGGYIGSGKSEHDVKIKRSSTLNNNEHKSSW
ncbi:MAG: hypothetical protein U9N39_09415 [Campylobacterota bacterium]|nr:hypothetical protein [Campylobacterota bacterium]